MSLAAATVAADGWLAVAAAGLALPVRGGGLPVAGQGAFVAVGGYVTALTDTALPLPLAVLLGVAAGAASGALVGLACRRAAAGPLGLATWAAAWLVTGVLLAAPGLTGGSAGHPVRTALRSPLLGVRWVLTPRWSLLAAGVALLTVLAAGRATGRGAVGARLALLRADPALARSLGVPVGGLRVGVVAAGAAAAALAGAGAATLAGVVAPTDVGPLLSIQLLAAVLVGGRWLLGPVLGVAVLQTLPALTDRVASAAGTSPVATRGLGTAALLLLALGGPRLVGGAGAARAAAALTAAARTATARSGWRRPGRRQRAGAEAAGPVAAGLRGAAGAVPAGGAAGGGRPGLVCQGLAAGYPGTAPVLRSVDLHVPAGRVVALIGPNGSGKTTVLRVAAGTVPLRAGTVRVGDRDVTALGEAARVRAGVVRTPQRTVDPALPAAEQVAAAALAGEPTGTWWRELLGLRSARPGRARRAAVARAALALVGLPPVEPPGGYDSGQLRLLQLARAAATGAPVLLLDEPAAGCGPAAVDAIAAAVRALAAAGRAVLVVEHDQRLVRAVADEVVVLADGVVLTRGTPDAVAADPAVQEVYLGVPVRRAAPAPAVAGVGR